MFSLLLGIGMALTAVSTAYGIVANQALAKQQAEIQERNAQAQSASLRQQAEQEKENQIQRSLIERRQNARSLARAETQYASSGVTLAGTPTLALTSMAEELELETIMSESASEHKRQLLLTDAENVLNFGMADANATRSAGVMESVGIGLSGASSMAMMGYEYSTYNSGVAGGYKNGYLQKKQLWEE